MPCSKLTRNASVLVSPPYPHQHCGNPNIPGGEDIPGGGAATIIVALAGPASNAPWHLK